MHAFVSTPCVRAVPAGTSQRADARPASVSLVRCAPRRAVARMSADAPTPSTSTPVASSTAPPRKNAVKDRALIFDCDGVIVESEELHRISYNQCWASEELGFEWSYEFYEMLQNSVGGGKEKMRWYFEKYGWPQRIGETKEERETFISHLHEKKTGMYKDLILNGEAKVRPGVLRLMDEGYDEGYRLAVCSAANASAVSLVLDMLVGKERLKKFDLILAGDVVSKKKPDPMIYNLACEKLGLQPSQCVVIEDSQIGLQAAIDANIRVFVTHTPYTASQQFDGAERILPSLGEPGTDEEVVTMRTLFPED